MKYLYLSTAIAPLLLAVSAHAQTAQDAPRLTAWEASRVRANDDLVVTGVARARDRLDSATSTSSINEIEVTKINATSLSDLLRTVPGIRAEAGTGDLNGNYTIRGLPLVGSGAKYIQLQEDGLPVLEFGDLMTQTPDIFLRPDFNLAQIESIRGGSSSTFASNAPGGVINLISKTGEVEGGSVAVTTGLNYDNYRADFDYGGHLTDTLRYHVGGFYREGEGIRDTGFTGNKGGQIKFNITQEFKGGFLRLEGKWLDDHVTPYQQNPMSVSGSNDDPDYASIANFPVTRSTLYSPTVAGATYLDGDNQLARTDLKKGSHFVVKSIGFQGKFKLFGWTIQEHLRYSEQSGNIATNYPLSIVTAASAPMAFGGRPGTLAYATGPRAGQAITDPSTLNGNGLLAYSILINRPINSLNNFTNDLRASRVWDLGGGELTSTVGIYNAKQDVAFDRQVLPFLSDIVGNGNAAMVNIVNTDGTVRTQDGFINFAGPGTGNRTDVTYNVFAPYGSLNYRLGKLSVGASLRLDSGDVQGFTISALPADVRQIDVNNDGVISEAERRVGLTPVARSRPVDYSYDYTSYSLSANYRLSQSFSAFGRYSRGGRAAADKILTTVALDPIDGSLTREEAGHDPVTQAEIGFKYRRGGLFANFTGFWAEVSETNQQIKPDANGVPAIALVSRGYNAKGGEFEGGIRRGPLSLTAGATYTEAEIAKAEDSTLIGNIPRRQPKFIFQLMPQYDSDLFTVGASVVGTTKSFAQDRNQLTIPAYITVNAFVQVRPIDRVVLSLNANNLFDTVAITEVSAASLPAGGLLLAHTLPGRNVSVSARFYF